MSLLRVDAHVHVHKQVYKTMLYSWYSDEKELHIARFTMKNEEFSFCTNL